MLNTIKDFWQKNRDEIITWVINIKHGEEQEKNKEEIEEKVVREQRAVKIQLILGVAYVLAGIFLFLNSKLQKDVIALELIILGAFALLHTFIFCCEQACRQEKYLVKVIKEIFILLMFPYYLCIKWIKAFIKDKRQGHITYLLPDYLLSVFIVIISFAVVVDIIAGVGKSEEINEFLGFIIVFGLIIEFWGCGKVLARFSTKSMIKSVQKAEVKRMSKLNWRVLFNDAEHKKGRKEQFEKEWEIVKKELEYTEIYFYILLTVFVLWLPKEAGSLTELLVNQFLGITTIAALAREAKAKKVGDSIEL